MRIMFDEVRNNKIKSWMLFTIFIVLTGLLGSLLGVYWGNVWFGVIVAVTIASLYSVYSFYSGSDMILSMSGAKPATKKEYPHLWHSVEGLAIAAGIPTPKAYVIEDSALNAFATGRDPKHAAVTVTTGLMNKLNRQELEGVIAHEIAHIKNYDVRFMMLAAVWVGVVTLLSDIMLRTFLWGSHGNNNNRDPRLTVVLIGAGLLLAILTPIIGQIIKMSISRKREYVADANGALLTRYPPGLASALKKISKDPDPLVDKANRATAHLFFSTPFRKKSGWLTNLFATHPPIQERIKRLESM